MIAVINIISKYRFSVWCEHHVSKQTTHLAISSAASHSLFLTKEHRATVVQITIQSARPLYYKSKDKTLLLYKKEHSVERGCWRVQFILIQPLFRYITIRWKSKYYSSTCDAASPFYTISLCVDPSSIVEQKNVEWNISHMISFALIHFMAKAWGVSCMH